MAEGVLIVVSHAVNKRVLAVNAMSQHYVSQLVRQDRREAGLVRKDVNQPAAQHDRVAHGERLERRGHQHAAAHFWLEDRKSTRLNSSHSQISYAVFCLKKKKK